MIAVDSSAILAVLFGEDDASVFAEVFRTVDGLIIAAPTLVECHFVVHAVNTTNGSLLLDEFIAAAEIETVSFDGDMAQAAIAARKTYGKGTRHPARLNFGDCISYALAKTRNVPLLFKGDDFVHTDITSALDVMS